MHAHGYSRFVKFQEVRAMRIAPPPLPHCHYRLHSYLHHNTIPANSTSCWSDTHMGCLQVLHLTDVASRTVEYSGAPVESYFAAFVSLTQPLRRRYSH